MSKLTNQWIELFRAGDHGEKGKFTDADLDQIVANYQPSVGHEAPLTIGHAKGDAPAYGWFEAVKREGSLLLGKLRQVQPEFEEMVEKGLFKKRSVGLAKDDKGWELHHVAFLGAQAPHIKGLADCKFADGNAPVVEVDFQENSMAQEAEGIIARLNAWFEEKFGAKSAAVTAPAAQKTFSEEDVKRIAGEAVTAAVKPLQDSLDEQKKQFSEREGKITTAEISGRAQGAITGLKAAGKWVPAFDKAGLPLVFSELAKTTETVEFGEGDAKKKVTVLDALVAFMEQLPRIVPNAEVYTGQSASSGAAKTTGVNETARVKADSNSLKLHQFAEARKNEKNLDYGTALAQVAAEHPELTVPGGAAVGAV